MNELEKRGQQIADAMGRYRGTEPLIEAVRRMAEQLFQKERRAEELEAVMKKIAARRPSTDRAAQAFYRSRKDAQEVLRWLDSPPPRRTQRINT